MAVLPLSFTALSSSYSLLPSHPLQEIHPSSLTPSYGEALEIAQRLALDGFLSLSKTRQSWAPFVTLELQVGRDESGEGNGSSKTAWQMQR